MYKATVKAWVNGKEQEFYTVGYVAKLLKRSVETVRSWERSKVIPPPMYRYKNNVRLYHPEEVLVMKKILKKSGKYARKEKLKEEMWEKLTELRKDLVNGSKTQGEI